MSRARRAKGAPDPEGGTPSVPKYRLRWTRRAVSDQEEIDSYIAADDPVAAERWVGRLMEQASKAAWTPYAGRVVPELGRVEIRELLLRSYRIVYRVTSEEIHVLTVFEGHRLFPEDLNIEPSFE